MKRINTETGQPFRCGDIREDGFIFDTYQKSKMVKKTGYYKEIWRNPESHKREMARKKSNKKKKYDSISKQVNDFKVKKGCVMCGYNENPIALDFHHFNKKMKENNVSSFFKSSWVKTNHYSWRRAWTFQGTRCKKY